MSILGGRISIVFYDVTTLYFEIDNEDDLRRTGFSKEGRHQNPQIVLGLLVSIDGYPLAYEIFEGNKFEGHTMLPIIGPFRIKYNLEKLVIIADSGLLSNANIIDLQAREYEFILWARIRNESRYLKKKILSLNLKNGESHVLTKDRSTKLVISYSDTRAKKDKANREKGTSLNPGKAIDIAKTIYSIRTVTPLNKELVEQTLILNEEQMMLKQLFEF